MAFMMKHIFARDFMPYFKEIVPLLHQLDFQGAEQYIGYIILSISRRYNQFSGSDSPTGRTSVKTVRTLAVTR
ncbi:MAG: hypothetical protein A3F41_03845 [Coxiella sp. RIFCSPHIGHO2_12_FULL_44_14]|nr:MAG: hypothetical protein A3F41_03845 [Coxiella sp. RIFCSPHIGHO2_12_FULL_44_14]